MNLKASLKSKDKVERMIDLAFDLISEVSAKTYDENTQFNVKVGIHGGSVIADIIGFHKVQFSLFGDPVNTTSRIASKAEDCVVTISDYIYKRVKTNSDYIFLENQIEVLKPKNCKENKKFFFRLKEKEN